MSTKTVNVAVVGLGFMGATHIKAYRKVPAARLVAVCNPSGRHLDGDFSDVVGNVGDKEPLKLDMRSIRATNCFEDLLKDPDVHVIDVCAPTAAHAPLVIAALQAGKHILCEKPLARSTKVASEIVEAANKARGFFMPAMCVRFWPETAWIWQVINEQTYGKVLSASFRRLAEPPGWGQQNFFNGAESGGALFDLHIHDTDFVQYCFGKPAAVTSAGYSKLSDAVDHVVTQYHFKPDANHPLVSNGMVHAEGGWAMAPGFGFHMSCAINCEHGTVLYDVGRGADALRVCAPGADPKTIKCDGPDGYVAQLAYFLGCVQSGRPPTVVTAQDAFGAVEICEAEEKSVQMRQTVTLT